MIHGGQTTAEIAQAENIINAALFVVRRARYVSGRVTEKYRSKLKYQIMQIIITYFCNTRYIIRIQIMEDNCTFIYLTLLQVD